MTLTWTSDPPAIAGVGQRYTLDYRGIYADVEVWQTRGYAGLGGAWVFRAPDLTGVTVSRSWFAGPAIAASATF